MKSERGNAVIEFIGIGLIAQLVIFSFIVQLGVDFRSEMAASAIARQSLRSMQLTSLQSSALAMADQVIAVFQIPSDEASVTIRNNCAQQGFLEVEAQVRGAINVAKGFCIL